MGDYWKLGPYTISGADREKTISLDNLTARYRDSLMDDRELQDVLLDDGYELSEEDRPSSYLDLLDMVWNRSRTIAHLAYANKIMELATRPQIVGARYRTSGELELARPDQIDPYNVELLQTGWFENPEIPGIVREYINTLERAMNEYNLKFVLCRIMSVPTLSIMLRAEDHGRIRAIASEITATMDAGAYVALDSAYYEMGNRFFRQADPLWNRLDSSDYGKFFRLTTEEEADFLRIRLLGLDATGAAFKKITEQS